jgi:hypothetical protein
MAVLVLSANFAVGLQRGEMRVAAAVQAGNGEVDALIRTRNGGVTPGRPGGEHSRGGERPNEMAAGDARLLLRLASQICLLYLIHRGHRLDLCIAHPVSFSWFA